MTGIGFVNNTRQNIRSFANMPYAPLLPVSCNVARVGLLASVYLRFKGTLTATHATKTTFAPAWGAPYNLAERIQLLVNNGTTLWNTSGYGAYLQNMTNNFKYNLDEPSAAFSFGNAASSAGAVNDLSFGLRLNVAINDKDPIGLFLLQNDATALTLQVQAALGSSLLSAADADVTAAVAGFWEVGVEFFSLPVSSENWPNLGRVHQVLEQSENISSIGENGQSLPRFNTYRRIINHLVLNGQPADAIEKMRLTYNLTETPYDITGSLAKAIQRERYGRDLPAGAYVWDFFYQGFPNVGANQRDLIHAGVILSSFDQFVIIKNDAVLGANNNKLHTIIDQVMQVVPITS
ncbi:MAG: hypothetical protein FWD39_01985 [Clostridiales bacterium]|nr:hypothetical protein [Clostridiales bacterium]